MSEIRKKGLAFADKFRSIRKNFGMSQVDFAKKIGVSFQNINNIEHCRVLPPKKIFKAIENDELFMLYCELKMEVLKEKLLRKVGVKNG